jgi:hypothetical protein
MEVVTSVAWLSFQLKLTAQAWRLLESLPSLMSQIGHYPRHAHQARLQRIAHSHVGYSALKRLSMLLFST